jgi:hypothetical protein
MNIEAGTHNMPPLKHVALMARQVLNTDRVTQRARVGTCLAPFIAWIAYTFEISVRAGYHMCIPRQLRFPPSTALPTRVLCDLLLAAYSLLYQNTSTPIHTLFFLPLPLKTSVATLDAYAPHR